MKIKQANGATNASAIEIKPTEFDSTVETTVTVEGRTYPQAQFLSKGKLIATLGVSGLTYAQLADDGNKPVGSVVDLGSMKEAEFKLPAKSGVISSVDNTEKMKRFFSVEDRINGRRSFQPIISGWKGADFAKA